MEDEKQLSDFEPNDKQKKKNNKKKKKDKKKKKNNDDTTTKTANGGDTTENNSNQNQESNDLKDVIFGHSYKYDHDAQTGQIFIPFTNVDKRNEFILLAIERDDNPSFNVCTTFHHKKANGPNSIVSDSVNENNTNNNTKIDDKIKDVKTAKAKNEENNKNDDNMKKQGLKLSAAEENDANNDNVDWTKVKIGSLTSPHLIKCKKLHPLTFTINRGYICDICGR